MKRNIFIVSLLALSLALFACNEQKEPAAPAPTPLKIAVVDAEQVFQRSKLASDGMIFIEEQSQILNQRLFEMQKQVEADPENQELSATLQAELSMLQQQFELDQVEAAEKINAIFNEVVEEYRKSNDLEAVLPVQIVISYRPGADITNLIVERMDKKTIDFFEGKERLIQPEAQESSDSSPE